ncbi:MAG: tetratricopeptide repeat protein [Bacteroidia bacterium]|nr:tetratricopeptide repeat protein [Bacteroidia bacterium]
MKGIKGPLLLGIIILSCCSILFVKGYKSAVKTIETRQTTVIAFDEKATEQKVISSLPEGIKKHVDLLEAAVKSSSGSASAYVALANLYDSLKAWPVSGSYYFKAAMAAPSEASWLSAGKAYIQAARNATDSAEVFFCIGKATESFEKVLSFNESNLDAKNSLALCLAQNPSQIMSAVKMLREVLAVDSNNVQATFTLGMLAIQSGQMDKAADRFEKLRRLEPYNTEYYYYLADIYNQLGRKEKAVMMLEECKALTKEQKAKNRIDDLIKEIQNN